MRGVWAAVILSFATLSSDAQVVNNCASGGYYSLNGVCTACPAGYACPLNTYITSTSLTSYKCPVGTWQQLSGQISCMKCPENAKCSTVGLTSFTACPTGTYTPPGSASCGSCTDDYYISGTICLPRKVCTTNEWENKALTGLGERVCLPISSCDVTPITDTCVSGGSLKCNARRNFITKPASKYNNLVCEAWAKCPVENWVVQMPVSDSTGFLVKRLVCKQYTPCIFGNNQYLISDGKKTETQDHVCGYARQSCAADEYIFQAATFASDIVCRKLTMCDNYTQFLLQMSDGTRDNICASITYCTRLNPSTYTSQMYVHATSSRVNGTDSKCKTYSTCNLGYYANFSGSDQLDTQCAKCPAGSYSSDGKICAQCPNGKYANLQGMTTCLDCTNCVNGNSAAVASINSQKYACPAGQTCDVAFQSLCKSSANSVCMQCPTSTWALSDYNNLCTPCAGGNFMFQASQGSLAIETSRCKPCTANFYCQSSTIYSICPYFRMYRNQSNQLVYIPSSAAGSLFPSECKCNVYGGFEGVATGLAGCQPCKDGWYALPGASKCIQCPIGKYSARTVQRNLFAAPMTTQDFVYFKPGDDSTRVVVDSSGATSGNMLVGASECVACPSSTPYTRQIESTKRSDCSMCPTEKFVDQTSGRCTQCTPQCNMAAGFFESIPCTDETNRRCTPCDTDSCLTGEYISNCPGPDSNLPERGCRACFGKPSNSVYVHPSRIQAGSVGGEGFCPWVCSSGYFSVVGTRSCIPCTQFNGSTCGAGMILSPCTETEDASCSTQCVDDQKPFLHSKWVQVSKSTTSDGSVSLTRDDSSEISNQGCMWDCDDGYRKQQTAGGMWVCRV